MNEINTKFYVHQLDDTDKFFITVEDHENSTQYHGEFETKLLKVVEVVSRDSHGVFSKRDNFMAFEVADAKDDEGNLKVLDRFRLFVPAITFSKEFVRFFNNWAVSFGLPFNSRYTEASGLAFIEFAYPVNVFEALCSNSSGTLANASSQRISKQEFVEELRNLFASIEIAGLEAKVEDAVETDPLDEIDEAVIVEEDGVDTSSSFKSDLYNEENLTREVSEDE